MMSCVMQTRNTRVMNSEEKRELMHSVDKTWHEGLLQELEEMDRQPVTVEGVAMKPSQCYHIGAEPPHILFNTNCPQELKDRVNRLLLKYRLA